MLTASAQIDRVAPWESVYKINLSTDSEVTFLLTGGGHDAGIISEPGHPRRHHRVAVKREGEAYVGAEQWFDETPVESGSWWPTWQRCQASHSSEKAQPPGIDNAKAGYKVLCDAPGTYVLEK